MKLSATSDTDPRAVSLEMTDPAASMAVHELWKHLDGDTRGHLVRVGQLAYDLARHIGLTAEERGRLGPRRPPPRHWQALDSAQSCCEGGSGGGADRPGATKARGPGCLTFYYKK